MLLEKLSVVIYKRNLLPDSYEPPDMVHMNHLIENYSIIFEQTQLSNGRLSLLFFKPPGFGQVIFIIAFVVGHPSQADRFNNPFSARGKDVRG